VNYSDFLKNFMGEIGGLYLPLMRALKVIYFSGECNSSVGGGTGSIDLPHLPEIDQFAREVNVLTGAQASLLAMSAKRETSGTCTETGKS
jgi:hypothetical protein